MKTLKRLHRSSQGFTLLEVVMYIAIFALIIGAIVGLAILVTSERQKNEVVNAVNLQGEAVMSLITQTINGASSITGPTPGNSASSLTLAMPTGSANPTVFSSFINGLTTRLEISEGSPATANYLTNSHVVLSGLNFTNKGLSGTYGSIAVSFTLKYLSTSHLQEFNFSKTFYGAASLP